MKIAYHYDYKTCIYQGESQIHKVAGYDDYILPQFSTWVAKPAFDKETEQAKFEVKNQKWLVELKPVEVTAYHKKTHEAKVFEDASLVTDDYTLIKPTSQFDEWDGAAWVENLDLAFNAEMDALNEKHYQDVLSATNQYNIAAARNGSTESDKVATARAILADLDAQFELDQLAIIDKYYGA